MERNDKGASRSASRCGHRRFNYYVQSRAGGRLYDAVHESWHLCTVPEADKTTAESLLVPLAAIARRLVLHGGKCIVKAIL